MRIKPYWKKGWLKKQYVEKKKSCREIAALCNVHPRTIRRYLQKYELVKTDSKKKPKIPEHLRNMFLID